VQHTIYFNLVVYVTLLITLSMGVWNQSGARIGFISDVAARKAAIDAQCNIVKTRIHEYIVTHIEMVIEGERASNSKRTTATSQVAGVSSSTDRLQHKNSTDTSSFFQMHPSRNH
jgi:hypothetical protein